MLNHIPPNARRSVTREYWIRVAVVTMLMVGSTAIVVAGFHVPTLVAIENQLDAHTSSYQAAASRTATFRAAEETVRATNQIAAALQANAATTKLAPYYDTLVSQAPSGVMITQFRIDRAEKTEAPAEIVVSGDAITRERLATFQARLEAHKDFAAVELPISNLAQSRDINFSMTLTPATDL